MSYWHKRKITVCATTQKSKLFPGLAVVHATGLHLIISDTAHGDTVQDGQKNNEIKTKYN